jgi:hypothetical protein
MACLDFVFLHIFCPTENMKLSLIINQTATHVDVRKSGSVVLAFLSLAIDKDEGSV